MAYKGYINPEVAKMYGIPYSQLTAEQKRILHEDSLFDWEAQTPGEVETPFIFTGYEYLDQITPQ